MKKLRMHEQSGRVHQTTQHNDKGGKEGRDSKKNLSYAFCRQGMTYYRNEKYDEKIVVSPSTDARCSSHTHNDDGDDIGSIEVTFGEYVQAETCKVETFLVGKAFFSSLASCRLIIISHMNLYYLKFIFNMA